MKVWKEIDSNNIDLWGNATYTRQCLTTNQVNMILEYLNEMYPQGINATDLNDFFAYNKDEIAVFLGYGNREDFMDMQ